MTAVIMQREIFIGLSDESFIFNSDGKERKMKGKEYFPIYSRKAK